MQPRVYIDDALETAYRAGQAHSAYGWSARISGDYTPGQVLVYLRGYHADNPDGIAASFCSWLRYTEGKKNV